MNLLEQGIPPWGANASAERLADRWRLTLNGNHSALESGTIQTTAVAPGDRITATVSYNINATDGEGIDVEPVSLWVQASYISPEYAIPLTTGYGGGSGTVALDVEAEMYDIGGNLYGQFMVRVGRADSGTGYGPVTSYDAGLGTVDLLVEPAAVGGITFTQLSDNPQPTIPTTAHGVLVLDGAAYESSLAALGGAASGYLTLVGGGPAGYVPEAPNYGIAEGYLALTGYAYAPGVEKPADADGFLTLDGYAFEAADVGYGTLALGGYATAYDGGLLPTPPGGEHWISLQDGLALTEAVNTRMTALLRTRMALDDRARTNAQAHANLSDGLALADEMAAIFQLLLESGFVLSDGLGFSHVALIRLHDRLLLTGQATASREAWARMAEAIAFGDMFEGTELVTFESGLSLADEAAARYEAAARLIDSILLSDSITDTFTVSLLLADSLALSDQVSSKAELLAVMRDSIGFTAHLRIKGEVYTAWTMNTDSRASTKYENYPFNSFMRVGGRHYGVTDSGLYRLDGDDDAGEPITAKIRLGMSSMGSRLVKQVPSVYLGYSASGDLLLKAVIADSENGTRESHVYRLHADGAGSTREGRTKLGKGLNAVYWDFEIENVNGADFDIDNIEFMPLTIQRRLRGNAGGK